MTDSKRPANDQPSDPNSDAEALVVRTNRPLDETSGFDSRDVQIEATVAPEQARNAGSSGANRAETSKQSDTNFPNRSSPNSGSTKTIGGYQLGVLLGKGGMGRVYKATDATGREVAIKLLSQDLARSPEALERFKQEGLIASQINHPHSVFVHRVDEDGGVPFIAMELMTGQTLKDLVLKRRTIPYQEALRLILQCIDGIIEAHSNGMIHRDIKPANCYLDEAGNVKVGDFGLARSLVGDSELTQTGAFLGTPLFASPEQLLGQSIDERSDIYSMTATLYYLLAGKAPFESPHAAQVIAKIASTDPPSFKEAGIEAPAVIESIVMKGLARDANKRYDSFETMRGDLLDAISDKSEPATLVRRCIAGIIDMTFMSFAVGLPLLAFIDVSDMNGSQVVSTIAGAVVAFVYFLTTESLFGTSIGKLALRLKVFDGETRAKAKFRSILIRTSVYIVVSNIIELIDFALFGIKDPILLAIRVWGGFVVVQSALLCTWWLSGRTQLLHDWVSGTVVRTVLPARMNWVSKVDLPQWNPLSLAESQSKPAFQSKPLTEVAKTSEAIPKKLGRFVVQGKLNTSPTHSEPWCADCDWVLARDQGLARDAWIAIETNIPAQLPEERRRGAHRSRMRFIEDGTWEGRRWYAFLAPTGVPLSVIQNDNQELPWPIVRDSIQHSLSEQSHSAVHMQWQRLWMDSSGRLCLAEAGLQSNDASAQVSHDFGANESLRCIALLGLPRKHRLRRALGIAKIKKSGVRAIEDLPTYSANKLLVRIAKGAISPPEIEAALEKTRKSAPRVGQASRFFNSLISLSVLTPAFFLAFVFLSVPSTILVMEARKEVRRLKTMGMILASPDKFPDALDGMSGQELEKWNAPDRAMSIQQGVEDRTKQLEKAFASIGWFESVITENVPREGEKLLDPPPFDLTKSNGSTEDASESNEDEDKDNDADAAEDDAAEPSKAGSKLRPSKMVFGKGREIQIDLGDGETNKSERMLKESKDALARWDRGDRVPTTDVSQFPAASIVCVGMGLISLVSIFSLGGLSQYFSGLCFMRRDGRKLGFIRSAVRAVLLYTPFFALAYLIPSWNASFDNLWWVSQFKKLFLILPLVYLVSVFIWSNATLLDKLTGTTAVPR
jgi:eukaryotic-like serine/threonine-protein kinase